MKYILSATSGIFPHDIAVRGKKTLSACVKVLSHTQISAEIRVWITLFANISVYKVTSGVGFIFDFRKKMVILKLCALEKVK